MSNQRRRDTAPELALRRELWRRGFRYRVDAPLPGGVSRRRADLVFRGPRVAVFVDGCFWHSCPQHATAPKSNSAWWSTKLGENRARDLDTDLQLQAAGWLSVRVWEHEDPTEAADRIEVVVRHRTSADGVNDSVSGAS